MLSDIEHYKKLSRDVNTQKDKINYFNQNQKAFYVDTFTDSWSTMMKAYAKEKNLSLDNINELEKMKWIDMPDSLKTFAYDFCILNGFVYTGVGK